MLTTIGEKVVALRERLGWSQPVLARNIGGTVKQQNINQVEDGTVTHPRYLNRLARTLMVSPEILENTAVTVETALDAQAINQQDASTLNVPVDLAGFANGEYDPQYHDVIRHYRRVYPSGGAGSTVDGGDDADVVLIAVDRQFMREMVGSNAASTAILKVRGESMADTLHDREIIFIDMDDTKPCEKIFVVRLEGHLLVKRLQKIPGGLRLLSDNPVFPAVDITQTSLDQLEIIGRVVWSWRGQRL